MPKEHKTLINKYLADDGEICPVCNSNDLQCENIEIESAATYQPVVCGSCESSWLDVYKLRTIERLNIVNSEDK